jgi:hypothetical protein
VSRARISRSGLWLPWRASLRSTMPPPATRIPSLTPHFSIRELSHDPLLLHTPHKGLRLYFKPSDAARAVSAVVYGVRHLRRGRGTRESAPEYLRSPPSRSSGRRPGIGLGSHTGLAGIPYWFGFRGQCVRGSAYASYTAGRAGPASMGGRSGGALRRTAARHRAGSCRASVPGLSAV